MFIIKEDMSKKHFGASGFVMQILTLELNFVKKTITFERLLFIK